MEWVFDSTPRPLYLGKATRRSLHRRSGGSQGQSGRRVAMPTTLSRPTSRVWENILFRKLLYLLWRNWISKGNSLPGNCHVLLKNVFEYSSLWQRLCFKTVPVTEHVVLFVRVKLSRYRPGQALMVPGGRAPRFRDSRYMKVVRLSALGTGRLCSPGNIPGTHFR